MDNSLFEKLACVKCLKPGLVQNQGVLTCSVCGQDIPLINDAIPDFLSALTMGDIKWKEDHATGEGYESIMTHFKETQPWRLERIDKPLLQYAHGDVLEIGCGTCRLAKPVEKEGARYFGLDPLLPFLSYGQKNHHLTRLVRGQAERLPFKSGSFDSIISGCWAYSFVDPEIALSEARRVLKKGGVFAFDLLNHWILKLIRFKMLIKKNVSLPSPLDDFEFVSLSRLKEKADKAHFAIEEVKSSPITPVFPVLNKYISRFYFKGKKTVYLGYDVIIVLRAV